MEINIEWKLSQINLHWRYIPIQITGISVLSWSRPTDRQRAYFRRPPRKTPRQRTKLARVLSKDENFCFFRRNFGEISCFGGRRNERGGRNVDRRNFDKFRLKSAKKSPKKGCRRKIGEIFQKSLDTAIYWRIFGLYRRFYFRFFGKFPDISYQSSPRTGYKIWSWFAGKACVFQPGSKIVDLGFVKFKSNGTTAKRTLKQIQKTQEAKKTIFLVFLGGFAWIFSEIKRGWTFPKNEWGMDFLGNQTGLQKNKNK